MIKFFDLDKIWSYVIASTMGFFSPVGVLILWLIIFVLADMITGVYASLVEGKIITSHGLQKTIVKVFMYCSTVVLIHAIEVYMIPLDLYLSRIISTLICGIELYSVFENCYRITNNDVFRILTHFTLKKIEEHTGVQVNEFVSQNKRTSKKRGKDANNI